MSTSPGNINLEEEESKYKNRLAKNKELPFKTAIDVFFKLKKKKLNRTKQNEFFKDKCSGFYYFTVSVGKDASYFLHLLLECSFIKI